LDLRAATLAGGKGFMVTPLKKCMEHAKNRVEKGRYANSFQEREMGCHGAGLIEGRKMTGAVEIME
jgi:hypothetical protein